MGKKEGLFCLRAVQTSPFVGTKFVKLQDVEECKREFWAALSSYVKLQQVYLKWFGEGIE